MLQNLPWKQAPKWQSSAQVSECKSRIPLPLGPFSLQLFSLTSFSLGRKRIKDYFGLNFSKIQEPANFKTKIFLNQELTLYLFVSIYPFGFQKGLTM